MNKKIGALALALAAACGSAAAAEPYVVYDDFNTSFLDPSKWTANNQERRRNVESNVLRLTQRDWGGVSGASGRVGSSWGENLSRGTAVTQLRSYVKVNALGMTGCAANPQPTRVRARLVTTYFNTGNRVTGSNVGDVLAQIFVYRDSNSSDAPGVMRVEGSLNVCTDSTCNLTTFLSGTGSLGTVNLGQYVLLQLEWDRALKQFTFTRDAGTANAASATISYNTQNLSLDDSAEPGNMFKSIGTRTDVANCTSNLQANGYIDAQFDTVAVNKTAKP